MAKGATGTGRPHIVAGMNHQSVAPAATQSIWVEPPDIQFFGQKAFAQIAGGDMDLDLGRSQQLDDAYGVRSTAGSSEPYNDATWNGWTGHEGFPDELDDDPITA